MEEVKELFRSRMIAGAMLARAYRFGVAEAFNVSLDVLMDTLGKVELSGSDLDRAEGMLEILEAQFELLEKSEDSHMEEIRRLLDAATAVREDKLAELEKTNACEDASEGKEHVDD